MSVITSKAAGAHLARRLLGVLPTVALILGALTVAWFIWPTSLGGCTTLTIVAGESMEPTYFTGDLVVARCGDPAVGDVIVYQPADVGGNRVIHRIVGGDAASGWVTQGDNNPAVDPWTPSGEEVLGVAGLHLPGVGRLALLLLSPVLWVSLVVLAGGLLLWPAAKSETEDSEAADSGAAHAEAATGGEVSERTLAEAMTK